MHWRPLPRNLRARIENAERLAAEPPRVDLRAADSDDVGTLSNDPSAPALILLPGLDGTGIMFSQIVEAIGASVETRIVAYPTDRPLGYAELEALVREALPRDRPYVVLGESFSGPIAIRLGADPPVGLAAIILCVTFAKNPYPLLGWAAPWASSLPVMALPTWVRAPFIWGASATERDRHESELATAAVGEAVLRHRIAAVLAVDETSSLARVRVPVLVLQASDDRVVPRTATEHMLRTLPEAEHVELRGPHMLLQIRAAECAAALRRFMGALQGCTR
jgi:pimeloyl-[acyl-carrier protein] methyl ester esterase